MLQQSVEEYMAISYIPWFAWIAMLGIVAGIIITVVSKFTERGGNKDVVERLDAVEARLKKIENPDI